MQKPKTVIHIYYTKSVGKKQGKPLPFEKKDKMKGEAEILFQRMKTARENPFHKKGNKLTILKEKAVKSKNRGY